MNIEIGAVISRLRREKGITQEQLATAVGVSGPAVSKWEAGQSYPDITLLPSLASYLNVSMDTLFGYEPALTAENLLDIENECNALFSEKGWEAGVARCKKLLLEYPGDCELKICIASVLDQNSMLSTSSEQKAESRNWQEALLLSAARSPDGKMQTSAHYLLACRYIKSHQLDKAEKEIAGLPATGMNPKSLLPSLYLLEKRFSEAETLSQENLFNALNGASNALSNLISIAAKNGDGARARRFSTTQQAMLKLFGVEPFLGFNASSGRAIAADASKDTEELLAATEQRVRGILQMESEDAPKLSDLDYFDKLPFMETSLSPAQGELLRKMLADDLGNSPIYAVLKENGRFRALLKTLKEP